jgi:hypothetical protein
MKEVNIKIGKKVSSLLKKTIEEKAEKRKNMTFPSPKDLSQMTPVG